MCQYAFDAYCLDTPPVLIHRLSRPHRIGMVAMKMLIFDGYVSKFSRALNSGNDSKLQLALGVWVGRLNSPALTVTFCALRIDNLNKTKRKYL